MSHFLQALLTTSLVMGALTVLLCLLMPMLRKRYAARALLVVWTLVLLGLLIPFRPQPAPAAIRLSAPPPATLRLLPDRTAMPPAEPLTEQDPRLSPETTHGGTPATFAANETSETTPVSAAPPFTITTTALAFAIWLAGCMAALLIRLISHRRFLYTLKRWRTPVQDPALLAIHEQERLALGLRRPVPLYECPALDSPMLIGLLRPAVLLPKIRLSGGEAALVLRHELSHLRSRDLWGRLLSLLAVSMHWFNPLVLLAAREAERACEAACDARVLSESSFSERATYSHTILSMLRLTPGIHTALSTRYHGGKKTMQQRLIQIMDTSRKRIGTAFTLLLCLCVLLSGMAVAITQTGDELSDAELEVIYWEKQDALANALSTLDAMRSEFDMEDQFRIRVLSWNTYYAVGTAFDRLITDLEAAGQEEDSASAYRKILQTAYEGVNAPMKADGVTLDEVYAAAKSHATAMGIDLADYPVYAYFRPYPGIPEAFDQSYAPAAYEEVHSVLFSRKFIGQPGIIPGDTFSITMTPDLRAISTEYTESFGSSSLTETAIPAKARDSLRETVAAFHDTHGVRTGDPKAPIYVSDTQLFYNPNHYTTQLIENDPSYETAEDLSDVPMAYVWVFSHHQENMNRGYDADTPAQNIGILYNVGIENGRIYAIASGLTESVFVNYCGGKTEYEQNGGVYPVIDIEYIRRTVLPQVRQRLEKLAPLYQDALSDDARTSLMLFNSFYGELFLTPDCEWERLLDTLDAVTDAESFGKALTTPYKGINNLPTEENIAMLYQNLASVTLSKISDYRDSQSLEMTWRGEELAWFDIYGPEGVDYSSVNRQSMTMTISKKGLITAYLSSGIPKPVSLRAMNIDEWKMLTGSAKRIASDVVETARADGQSDVVLCDFMVIHEDERTSSYAFIPYEENDGGQDDPGYIVHMLNERMCWSIRAASRAEFDADMNTLRETLPRVPNQQSARVLSAIPDDETELDRVLYRFPAAGYDGKTLSLSVSVSPRYPGNVVLVDTTYYDDVESEPMQRAQNFARVVYGSYVHVDYVYSIDGDILLHDVPRTSFIGSEGDDNRYGTSLDAEYSATLPDLGDTPPEVLYAVVSVGIKDTPGGPFTEETKYTICIGIAREVL